MTVVTRFAPSPTGFLHIGGARTALFSWLFAKHHQGKFLLRIEDTDRKRSTQEAIDAIISGLSWLGLEHDDDIIFQTKNQTRHVEIANQLLNEGKAYKCYCTQEELQTMRDEATANNQAFKYNRKWRDKNANEAPEGVDYVIRIKAPLEGRITVNDLVQGEVSYPCEDLDDMVILRADGTPTYMLAVVVDDHDMNVTHIIRGDDHHTNTFRQRIVYDALNWLAPQSAHIPLINGPDGKKLSKRHGALGIEAYRDMGYLPEALRNYLLRLGWSHGDDEIISTQQAIEWFDGTGLGRSPSNIDFDKMASVNAHYIKESDNDHLLTLVTETIEEKTGTPLADPQKAWILAGMNSLKDRSKTLLELTENALFYVKRVPYTEKAQNALSEEGKAIIAQTLPTLEKISPWNEENISSTIKQFCQDNDLKMGKVFQPIRAGVCGTMESPSLTEVLEIIGKEETLSRLSQLD